MYKIIFISIIGLFTSCFGTPTNEPKEEVGLLPIWSIEHGTAGDAPPIVHEGKIIMSGGLFVYALEEETGKEIWKYQFEDDNILQGRIFLINDNQVVVAHIDKIRAWNILDGALEWEFDYQINEMKPRLIGKHATFLDKYGFTSEGRRYFILNRTGGIELVKNLDSEFGVQGLTFFNDKLYVSQGNTIHGLLTLGRITALNAHSGDSLWAYNTELSGFSAAPIIEEGIVYAGTRGNSPENTFVALDAETGELIWEYVTENQTEYTESLIMGLNLVYLGAGGVLVAFDRLTGEKVWQFSWTSSTLVKPVYLEGFIYHSDHSRLFVIDGETGELVHEKPLPEGGGFIWHIATSLDKIFVQTSNQLIAYQPWHLRD